MKREQVLKRIKKPGRLTTRLTPKEKRAKRHSDENERAEREGRK